MVIYGDVLFLLNFCLDYGLLLACARVACVPFVRLRLALGAAFGGVCAVLIFVPPFGALAALPARIGMGVVMALIAYGGCHRFGHVLAVFFAVTAALGGGVLALTRMGDATMRRGVAVSGADLLAVLLIGSLGCGVIGVLFRRSGDSQLRRQDFVRVELELNGRRTTLRALVDTGNALTDRNQRSVLVADWPVVAALFEPGTLNEADFSSPVSGFAKLAGCIDPRRVQLVPYATVGVSGGVLLAVRPDAVRVDGRSRKGMLVAGAAKSVSSGGAYQGLLGAGGAA